ncbi:MAG: MarR family transcriptional regulator [Oscillospiraceae bacterium]|nr:MarR family transcriptional regulator [Oscillospiraceae bacterium]
MDMTERKISRIARVVNRFSTRIMRQEGIGPSEFDFVFVVRHHPGITQAELCQKLDLDKGAAARLSARLEEKGYLRREPNPDDGRSQLLFATERSEELRNSKAHIEEAFYEWLTEPLSREEQAELARLLDVLDRRCREGREDRFAAVEERLREE